LKNLIYDPPKFSTIERRAAAIAHVHQAAGLDKQARLRKATATNNPIAGAVAYVRDGKRHEMPAHHKLEAYLDSQHGPNPLTGAPDSQLVDIEPLHVAAYVEPAAC